MTAWEKLEEEFHRCAERRRQDYEALAEIAGLGIQDLQADLTAPDPHTKEGTK